MSAYHQPVALTRHSSEETLSSGDLAHDLDTMRSASSTMVDTAFGRSNHEFNHVRTLPVVSSLFKKGLYVFPSESALLQYKTKQADPSAGTGIPLFKAVQPSTLGFSKKNNHSIMTFYKYTNAEDKFVFCRVFAKSMREQYGVTRYTFKFSPNGKEDEDPDLFEVVMFSCTNAPVNDAIYKQTKLRWIGSTLSEPVKSFKLIVLSSGIPSFCDNMDPDDPIPSDSPVDLGLKVTEIPPVARFCEHKPSSKRGLVQTADMKVIEAFEGKDKESVFDVPESSLVTVCMAILLEEQRKNMGSSKNYDVAMFS